MSNIEALLNQIHHADCLDVLDAMPESCVDVCFCDPPYNLQLQQDLERPDGSHVDAVRDAWDSFHNQGDYEEFTKNWLLAVRRVLKSSGTLWVIGSYHNIYIVGYWMQKLGYWLLNDVVWVKANPMPQMRGVRLCNAHETLLWAKPSKEAKGYTFHYQDLKAANGGKQLRSDWYFNICQGSERLKGPDGKKLHSTQKPLALMERIVLASTKPGDVCLEPFAGTSTFCLAAKNHGRDYIAIEKEAVYVEASRQRLSLPQ